MIGYASELNQWIANNLFWSAEIKQLSLMSTYEANCAKRNANGICRKAYVIPVDEIKAMASNFTTPSLSMGLVLRAVGVRCDQDQTYFQTFGNIENPGSDRGESNRTKILDVSNLRCRDILVVEAWSSPQEKRFGWIGGKLLIGETETIAKLKKVTDFWLNDFRIVLSILLLALWFLVSIVRRNLISNYDASPLERALPWLACSNLLNSGLLLTIIPLNENPDLINGISLLLSTLAFKAVLFKGKNRAADLVINGVLCSLFLSNFVSTYKLGICAIFIALCIVEGIRKKSNVLLFFGIFGTLATLKILNINWAPHSHVHAVYAFVILTLGLRRKLGQILVSISRQIKTKGSSSWGTELQQIINSFLGIFPDARVELFITNAGDRCQLVSASTKRYSSTTIEIIPSEVANVLSTGVGTGIRHKSDREMRLITKNLDGLCEWLAILPVKHSSQILGVLELKFERLSGWDNVMELDTIQISADILITSVAEALNKQGSFERGENLGSITDVVRSLDASLMTGGAAEDLFREVGATLTECLDCSCMVMELVPQNRELKVLTAQKFSEEAREYIDSVKFFALEDNRHGPVALAINQLKIIAIEDLSWLKQGLKDKTQLLFNKNGSRSGLALPVVFEDLGVTRSFVIWLESRSLRFFRPEFINNYQILLDFLFRELNQRTTRKQVLFLEERLLSFVPESARKKMEAGIDPTEIDSGYLLMIDIKGSTRLSLCVGLERYKDVIAGLRARYCELFAKFDFELQEYRWDAFYLTRSNLDGLNNYHPEKWQEIFLAMMSEFSEWKSSHPDLVDLEFLDFRACIVEGDITRGLSVGKTSSWTVLGTAMAKVSKLESVVKPMTGHFFSLSSERLVNSQSWTETEIAVPGLESGVVVIFKTEQDSAYAA